MPGERSDKQRMARLFFALWPDDDLRRRFDEYRPTAGRPIAPANWHITLVFLGGVGCEQQSVLERAADGIVSRPFTLRLDRFGYWRRARIAWLGATDVPRALLALQEQLNKVAEDAGVAVETRKYHPHLTLARDAPMMPEHPIDPIEWQVSEFCLVESVIGSGGSQYTVRQRWQLDI